MDDSEIGKRVDALGHLLNKLSDNVLDSKDLDGYIESLKVIYSDGYRQLYSDIYPIVKKIRDEKGQEKIQYLIENVESIVTCLKTKDMDDGYSLFSSVLKLSDHLNLEVQRMVDYEGIQNDISKAHDESSDLYLSIKKSMNTYDKKIKRVQTELVVILSIMATLLTLFSGSITVLGDSISVLGNPHSIHELILVILICGLILFNSISLLMGYIFKMIDFVHEDDEPETERIKKWITNPSTIQWILLNVILILALIIDIYLWN